jgi:PhzF family phenazine biosynthesis protein
MSSPRRFKQVDVFTEQPFSGNPVAVVLEADGLESEEMQRIAAWTNLSETTFVLPPTQTKADYRLRIFTANSEVPFAGHPTIGSAHALLESGLVSPAGDEMIQECGAGLLPLRLEGSPGRRSIFVKSPSAGFVALDGSWSVRIASALGAEPFRDGGPLVVNLGAVWLVVRLESEEAVHRLQPDQKAVLELSLQLQTHGITVFALADDAAHQTYVRSFAPAVEVPEDPVCGSGNAAVAAFLVHHDLLDLTGRSYTAHQGHELGRKGVVHVRVPDDDSIEIGGSCVTCIDGLLVAGG